MGLDFNTSYSGLSASQSMIKVAQNNIANANVDGYARQRLEVNTSGNISGSGVEAQIGSGVISQQVVRIKDDMLISQVRTESSKVNYYTQMQRTLQNVENVFNENSEGSISSQTSNFFNAWDEVNKFPEEKSYRLTLLSESSKLTNKLNATMEQLTDLSSKTDTQIDIEMNKINDLVKKIAVTNDKLNKSMNEHPNALLDERDRYIDELSKFIDVKVEKSISNPNLINVTSGGVSLVTDATSHSIRQMKDAETGQVTFVANGTVLNPKDGSIKASLELKNEYIPNYIAKLNEFTQALITEVNTIHQSGYGIDNTTGLNFFTGGTAGSISVNNVLYSDTNKIALSSMTDKPGNSEQGKSVSALRELPVMEAGKTSMKNYFNGFVIEMATDLNSVRDSVVAHENVWMALQTNKQSIQGVNIDEEMTNLLQYQQLYQANAKAIKAVDDIFNQLFSIIR